MKIYLKPPAEGILPPSLEPEAFLPPKKLSNLFLKSLITASNSGGV
jgi:hypothetical protein